jgi:uncharacterized membrane protein YkoI
MNVSKRKLSTRTGWITAAAVTGALLGSAGVAMAQTDSSGTTGTTTAAANDRVAETPLTGDVAAKATAAAQAAVPGGTIDRVETDSDGSPYEAHVTKADGTKATVKIDSNFAVTSIDTDAAHGKSGGKSHGGHGGGGETPLTGDVATKVTAAAQAAVPGGAIDRVETDSDGSPYEAHITKADGTKVTVKVDSNFAVTSIDTH